MATEEAKKKIEHESSSEPPQAVEEPKKDVTEEKAIIPLIPPPEEKPDESKALALVEKIPEKTEEKEKSDEGSINRDAALERLATEKRLTLIKAWEESERSKAENKEPEEKRYQMDPKAHKKLSGVGLWENSKKAAVEADLKQNEEKLEKKRAEYVEKMKNKIALIQKEAEEKKATIEAERGEDLLKAEESAAKYRATGTAPKKLLGCF